MKRRRSKKGSALTGLVITLLSVILCAVLLLSFVFVVRDVRAEGTSDVSEERLIRASGIAFGKSLLTVDEERARRGIDALGTVAFEGLRVRAPSTVILTVRAREREAMFLTQGSIVVLDGEGYVVEKLPNVPEIGLPYISGMSATAVTPGSLLATDAKKLSAYSAIIAALNENDADELVSEIKLDDPEDLRIATRTGMEIVLGDENNMTRKIAFMKGAVLDLEQRGSVSGTLDVSSGDKADYTA